MSRDELDKYKDFTLFEEERGGKFVFYGESSSGQKTDEITANPGDVVDPSKNTVAEILSKLKEQIDSM